MRHSIRFKISIMIFVCVLSMVGIVIFMNTTLFNRFYLNDRTKTFEETYHQVNVALSQLDADIISQEEFEKNLEQITATMNISMMLLDENWDIFYASMRDVEVFLKHLQKSLFLDILPGKEYSDSSSARLLINREDYSIYNIYNQRMNDSYLELIGNAANGKLVYMTLALKSIEENVEISNRFIIYVGIFVAVLAAFVAYLLGGIIAKPIKELSSIAEKMSDLDFDARYERDDQSEIGVLGHSMNTLSGKLKTTISELKSANMQLKKDIENKEAVDEMRKDFISNVSHELKTPIALIQGYAEGLKEGITDDPESMDYYCDVIIDESAKMNNMVKQLLTLNQLEFGNLELDIERFDVLAVIEGVIGANKLLAEQKGITITFSHEPYQTMPVWADEFKVEQVLTNYLTNAIHHCEGQKQIEITATCDENVAHISVFNTGKTIPKEDLDKIWIKFFKVDKARTREYGGSGIGLSIVKAIMDQMNQKYGVTNKENGVEFWFELDAKTDFS